MLALKAGVIGTLCVGAGAWMLFSETRHSLTGVHATAVLVERVTECKAEFQPVGESRRKEAMPCDQAEAFRAVVGDKKVRVHKTFLSVLKIPGANGVQHTARVSDATMGSIFTPIGGTVQVVYTPGQPDDVRPPMTLARVQGNLGMMGLGVVLLLIAFFGPILRMLQGAVTGKADAETGQSAQQTAPEVPQLTRGQLVLQEAAAAQAQRLRTGAAPQQGFGRRAEARLAAAGGSRR